MISQNVWLAQPLNHRGTLINVIVVMDSYSKENGNLIIRTPRMNHDSNCHKCWHYVDGRNLWMGGTCGDKQRRKMWEKEKDKGEGKKSCVDRLSHVSVSAWGVSSCRFVPKSHMEVWDRNEFVYQCHFMSTARLNYCDIDMGSNNPGATVCRVGVLIIVSWKWIWQSR